MRKLSQVFSTLFGFAVCYQMSSTEGAKVLPARRHETRRKLVCCISRARCCSVSIALVTAKRDGGGNADRHHTLFLVHSRYQVIS